jgi:hypothetical protein
VHRLTYCTYVWFDPRYRPFFTHVRRWLRQGRRFGEGEYVMDRLIVLAAIGAHFIEPCRMDFSGR